MTDERMQSMSCGHEIPQDEVQTHYHETDAPENADDEERRRLAALPVTALGVAGLTAVAYGLAHRRLNKKKQE